MSIFSRRDKVGDSKVAYLEGLGGRPTITGEIPQLTQENLMRAVSGLAIIATAEFQQITKPVVEHYSEDY